MNLLQGDCLEMIRQIPDRSVDLTVTSPPYDNLRSYNGMEAWGPHIWMPVIDGLYRVTKDGGVVVWIVNDATVKGSETGTSFRQALYAMDCGFNLHDTMIWDKGNFTAVGALVSRYAPVFEYMFVFSKGKPKTFNPIKDKPNKDAGTPHRGTIRQRDGSVKPISGIGKKYVADFGQRHNVWALSPEKSNKRRFHPAMFPESIAEDHIRSWSNEGEIVLDPFMGSGTTGVAAKNLGRDFIGIELDPEYFAIAERRINGN